MMSVAVANDLTDSAFDFQRLVWPAIADWCGGGEYVPVESTVERPLANDLDFYAGIDGYHRIKTKGVMRGIASRIQWCDHPWNTFTIRKSRGSGASTELDKRLNALHNLNDGWLYPTFTVQAYISQRRIGNLLSVAISYTRQLIPYAKEKWKPGRDTSGVRERWAGNNSFLAVDWYHYMHTGFFIKTWPDITPDVNFLFSEWED